MARDIEPVFGKIENALRAGDAEGALRLCAALPRKLRDQPTALKLHGIAAYMAGRPAKAVAVLSQYVSVVANDAAGWVNLGNALSQTGRFSEAVSALRRGVELEPAQAPPRFNLGNALLEQREDGAAEIEFRAAIAIRPNHPPSHLNLSIALRRQGKVEAALAAANQAVSLAPAWPEGHLGQANCLEELGQDSQALQALDRALLHKPELYDAQLSKARIFFRLGRDQAGATLIGTILAIPEKSETLKTSIGCALSEIVCLLKARRQFANAAAACRQAGELTPREPWPWVQLADCEERMGRLAEAEAAARTALRLDPGQAKAEVWLIHRRRIHCDWAAFDGDEQRMSDLARREDAVFEPLPLLFHSVAAADQRFSADRWAKEIRIPDDLRLPAILPRNENRRLRLGYLSGDFRNHPVGLLVPEVIERHDRQRFTVFGYALNRDDGSEIRRRLEGAFDHLQDLKTGNDREIAERIRADGIDILIDLTGITEFGRPTVLLYRPAPVTVSFLGFPGTMGEGVADYVIADAIVAPMEHQPWYAEKLIHMPDCYQPSDTKGRSLGPIPSRSQCGLPDHGPVFCSFCTPQKITPAVFAIWMEILAAVPEATLWLFDGNPQATANLRREAERSGLASRLVFAGKATIADYLARMSIADLFLDTTPYGGGATVNDALWAGLPVLTVLGSSYVGRMAASLVHAAGLPDMVMQSLAEYRDCATALARDPQRLSELKLRLAGARRRPLFDMGRYTRNLESAYQQIWTRCVEGIKPEAFAIIP